MRRIAALCTSSLLLALPVIFGGCVKQSEYDAMLMTNRSLQEQLVSTQDERDVARANLDTVRGQLQTATGQLTQLRDKYNLTEEDLKRMGSEYETLMARVSGLNFGPLPADMEIALQQLAAQHPNLLSFDAKRGMLRFASDFTFDLGSADLNSTAESSLSQLASILNSDTARNFEVRVIGHTDNVRIAKPDTLARHPTNLHLSVHRAISVGQSLMSSGIEPVRIQVAGYGEHRPIVANAAKGGAAENRRVEIFLTPMPDSMPGRSAVTAQPDITEPMK